MVVNQTSADSITGFFPNGNRSPTVCSQCAILPENRNRPLNDRPRFHTLKEVCGMERLAPERQVLIPYAHAFNGQWSLQACSFVFPGGGPVDPLLRASNEALPRARVPRAGGDTRPPPPLLLQIAEEGVPREAQERKAAHFLFLDCGGSNGTDDLDHRITLNSSNRRDLPFSFLAYDPLDMNDCAAMPAIESCIVSRGFPVQPAYFRPPCLIAQPGSFLSLQFT